jgi:hypothetical protein
MNLEEDILVIENGQTVGIGNDQVLTESITKEFFTLRRSIWGMVYFAARHTPNIQGEEQSGKGSKILHDKIKFRIDMKRNSVY